MSTLDLSHRPSLTTGWEADTPADDTLLRRFVLAHADRLAGLAHGNGGAAHAGADALLADSGSPFPFDNAAVLVRPPTAGSLGEVVAQARAFFPAGRPWVLLSVWPTGDLRRLGLRLVGHPPLMFRPSGPVPPGPSPVPGFVVREAEGARRRADFESTLAEGFPLVAAPGYERPAGDGTRFFVGYADGRPVSVAAACPAPGLVEIDWVATLPSARRRGYGTAVMAAALAGAPGMPTVLLASDAGRPVYRRLGFVDLLRTTIWEVAP